MRFDRGSYELRFRFWRLSGEPHKYHARVHPALPENKFAKILIGGKQDGSGLVCAAENLCIGNSGRELCYG